MINLKFWKKKPADSIMSGETCEPMVQPLPPVSDEKGGGIMVRPAAPAMLTKDELQADCGCKNCECDPK
jgi:hypothetical protein